VYNAPLVQVKLSRYGHADAKGVRKCSSYSFLTSALDGGEWSTSCPGHTLTRGKDPPLPIYNGYEAGWAWTEAKGKIFCLCQGSNHSRPVCSKTQYGLSYPSYNTTLVYVLFTHSTFYAVHFQCHELHNEFRTKQDISNFLH
jgi:hypothetical protein